MDINWPELFQFVCTLLTLVFIGNTYINLKRINNRLNRLEARKCS